MSTTDPDWAGIWRVGDKLHLKEQNKQTDILSVSIIHSTISLTLILFTNSSTRPSTSIIDFLSYNHVTEQATVDQ